MSRPAIRSLADLAAIIAALPGPDETARARWAAREPHLTKPHGALGRLEAISGWLSAWQGRHPPRLERPAARVFAGNHGVAARGVSAYPADVTVQMVANFEAGGAAINQICTAFGIELAVTALDLDHPTADFTAAPALTEDEFFAAFAIGMASVPEDCDVLCVGEMGIGNTTPAAAIATALFGGEPARWVGPGTGLVSDGMARKIAVVAEGVALHGHAEPLDLARRLGGRELAAMAGAVVAARLKRVPVLLDGYVCCAAVAPLAIVNAHALDHCMVAHCSAEPGHRHLLERLALRPLLDLDMRLGEASGAALAVGILKGAVACHTGMATFGEAGVSGKDS